MIIDNPPPQFIDDFEHKHITSESGKSKYKILNITHDFNYNSCSNVYVRFGYACKKCELCKLPFKRMEINVVDTGYITKMFHPKCYIEAKEKELEILRRYYK